MRWLVAAGMLVACSQKLEPLDTSTPIPSDADADADADADTDADTDADADADSNLDCTTPYPTPQPDGEGGLYPECVTQRIFCGEVLEATTMGGSTLYDYDFWLDNQSLSSLINKPELVAGPERVFVVEPIFSGSYAAVRIESCNPVWASWIATGDVTPYCATDTLAPMEHFYEEQGRYIQEAQILNTSIGEYGVQLIIDSEPGWEGNFIVTVDCGQ